MADGRDGMGLTRRSFLWRWGVASGVLSVTALLTACGGAPASPAAKPTEAPKPAAAAAAPTTAPAAAAAATTAPAAPAAAKPTAPAQTGKKKYEGVTLKYAAIASMGAGVEQ